MEKKYINVVAEEYLRSLKQEEATSSTSPSIKKDSTVTKKGNKWISKALTSRKTTILTFVQLEKSNLLSQSLEKHKNVLDFYSWQDLDLLCGNKANPDKNVHAQVDRTTTTLGKCVLATRLVSPSATQEEVEKKQEVVKALCEDTALKKNIERELLHIKESERKRASLWSKSSPIKHIIYKNKLQSEFYGLSFGPGGKNSLTLWRTSPTSASKLQWLKRLSDFLFVYFMVLYIPLVVLLCIYIMPIMFNVFFGACMLFLLYSGPYGYYKRRKPIISFLAEHMATLQTCLKSAYRLNKLVMAHPKLSALYQDELKAVRYLWAMGKKKNDIGQMLRTLGGPSFKNWRYFMGPTGKLLAAYTIFEKHKGIFSNAFYEIGKLDVHLSTASLLLESENTSLNNRYVVANVLSPKAKEDVVVKGERLWHPCLAPETAVPNDLALDSQKGNRLIVITGANMGGKSTYILSGGLAALLSQCLGIAPAKSFTHTCFKKFITYVNPSQNLARGLSLAGAAFEVLKTHKQALVATDGPVFAIVDEILNGVDAKMGLDVSSQTLKSRYEKYPNCVTLLTTHYMKLSELDKLPGVANKHVEAIVKGKGVPIEFTYKILDGPSKQNIVKDIVSNMGIVDHIS